jgi:hypothetical protein
MFRIPYKDYSSLNRWQANWIFLSAFTLFNLLFCNDAPTQGKKVSFLPLGDVNLRPVPSMRGLLEDSPYRVVWVVCPSCDELRPCT